MNQPKPILGTQNTTQAVPPESKRAVWALEDDPACQFIYQEVLGPLYRLRIFSNLEQFTEVLGKEQLPDLVIADLRLPDGSFLSFISHTNHPGLMSTPFIVVSSLDDETILRLCFAEGALDYITKPFGKNELMVKVERLMDAQLKRDRFINVGGHSAKTSLSGSEALIINPTFFAVSVGDSPPTTLTPKELQIITLLQQSPNQTISRQEIIKCVWKEVKVGSKTLDVHLFNLRKKLQGLNYEIKHSPPNLYSLVGLKAR